MRPLPWMVSDPGSFAEHTIVRRKPEILASVIAYNTYPSLIEAGLGALRCELACAEVAPLSEPAPDVAAWLEAWRPWAHHTWRQLPWFWAETYFYRRLLEVVRYFQPGRLENVDPFEKQKAEALDEGLPVLARTCAACAQVEDPFDILLSGSLWGNRADLSNMTIARSGREIGQAENVNLLIDHRPMVAQALRQGISCLAWVLDNSGPELLHDLALLDWLLSNDRVAHVQLHAKAQPFFVSDTMPKDVLHTVATLRRQPGALGELGSSLDQHLEDGRLEILAHSFWTTWQHFSALPDDLHALLAQANLTVFKGDANYRRLVEDRRWPASTPLEDVVERVPRPLLCLRTLKSEVMLGLAPGRAEKLDAQDPKWLINGRWGVIHWVA